MDIGHKDYDPMDLWDAYMARFYAAAKEFNKYAKRFAKNKGMKLLRVSPSFYHITRSGKLIYLPTQYELLWYFKNADYILFSSYGQQPFL